MAELHYGNVATQTLADGTKVSLWATEPAANPTIRSSCFYLDQETTGGGAHGFGGCGGLDQKVTLNRDGQVLFGSVGSWPAKQVSLSGGGADMTADVVNGHFLALPSLASPGAPYRVSLFADGHTTIGTIDSLIAPGSAVPTN